MSTPRLDRLIARLCLLLRFFRLMLNSRRAACILQITFNGYLAQTGWLRSMQEVKVQDSAGEPMPWYTIPFVDYLGPRIMRSWRIFEYGAGASTFYYARRVDEVWTVEHDAAFAGELRPRLPGNVHLLVHPENSDAYADAPGEMPAAADFISVDGRDRVRCLACAVGRLSPAGVLVLDDSERPEYASGIATLRVAGFRSLEFWGIAAGTIYRKCTTVYYRDDNILGI